MWGLCNAKNVTIKAITILHLTVYFIKHSYEKKHLLNQVHIDTESLFFERFNVITMQLFVNAN